MTCCHSASLTACQLLLVWDKPKCTKSQGPLWKPRDFTVNVWSAAEEEESNGPRVKNWTADRLSATSNLRLRELCEHESKSSSERVRSGRPDLSNPCIQSFLQKTLKVHKSKNQCLTKTCLLSSGHCFFLFLIFTDYRPLRLHLWSIVYIRLYGMAEFLLYYRQQYVVVPFLWQM